MMKPMISSPSEVCAMVVRNLYVSGCERKKDWRCSKTASAAAGEGQGTVVMGWWLAVMSSWARVGISEGMVGRRVVVTKGEEDGGDIVRGELDLGWEGFLIKEMRIWCKNGEDTMAILNSSAAYMSDIDQHGVL